MKNLFPHGRLQKLKQSAKNTQIAVNVRFGKMNLTNIRLANYTESRLHINLTKKKRQIELHIKSLSHYERS